MMHAFEFLTTNKQGITTLFFLNYDKQVLQHNQFDLHYIVPRYIYVGFSDFMLNIRLSEFMMSSLGYLNQLELQKSILRNSLLQSNLRLSWQIKYYHCKIL